jgi:hypothetical protein
MIDAIGIDKGNMLLCWNGKKKTSMGRSFAAFKCFAFSTNSIVTSHRQILIRSQQEKTK